MKRIVIITIATLAALLLIFFYFIPAFKGQIEVYPSFGIGNITIRYYGMTMALAIFCGYLIARFNSERFGFNREQIDNLSFWLTIVGIIGARLYFVLFDFEFFRENPEEIYKLWHGGLSIFGAIFTGLVFIIFYSKKKVFSPLGLLDLTALSMPLAQAVGRLGNFFNQEAFGRETNLPWKMFVANQNQFAHPAFLYEALGLVILFFALKNLLPKRKPGDLFFLYIAGYSLIRFFVESLRQDSVFIAGFRADQVVAFLGIIISCIFILFRYRARNVRHPQG